MIYSSIFSMTDFANLFINDGIYTHLENISRLYMAQNIMQPIHPTTGDNWWNLVIPLGYQSCLN